MLNFINTTCFEKHKIYLTYAACEKFSNLLK